MDDGEFCVGDCTAIPQGELTWWENRMADLGWFFCEISFEWSPNFAWNYLLYPSWCHSIGSWFYEKAFTRWWTKNELDSWKH